MKTGDQIIIYKARDGQTRVDVKLKEETVWLTQKQIAVLLGKKVTTINDHIHNVYTEKELKKKPTIRKFRIVQKEGNRQISRNRNN